MDGLTTAPANILNTPGNVLLYRNDDGSVTLNFGVGDIGVVLTAEQFKTMTLEMVRIATMMGWTVEWTAQ